MTIFTVHLPVEARDPETIAGEMRLVRDGWSFWAFLLGPLWLMSHRAWLAGFVVLALIIALGFLPDPMNVVADLLFSILLGIEGWQLVRLSRSAGGWHMVDVVEASSEDEAARIALTRLLTSMAPPLAPMQTRARPNVGEIGLFPMAGG
jgi:hypothetical protein